MSRKPRVHVPGGFYHAILRGNSRQPIFFCSADRTRWENHLAGGLQRYGGSLHGYCWMTNHVHLLVQVGQEPLSRIMQYAAMMYARESNRMLRRSGHLFERRHRAIMVASDDYLMGLVRYIHNNPVRAQLVDVPEAYAWSSHAAYLGEVTHDWLRTDRVWSLFSGQRKIAIRRYRAFMNEAESHDSWREAPGEEGDARLLAYFEGEKADDIKPRRIDSLESIINQHCARHQLSLSQLTGPSRARHLARLRTDIAVEALDKGAATLAELSRRFNRSESTICEAVKRRRQTT